MLKSRWRNSVIIYQMHHRADNGINAVVTRTVMRKRRVTARDEWHWQGDISFQSVMKWRGMLATIAVNSPRGRKWTLHIMEVCTHGTRSP
ncbi:MAG TPA: hypothetical protein EYP10_06580 [Armatimonadetes bacterium]|nr:hypothetical protein [Armatimonadota bacterium]